MWGTTFYPFYLPDQRVILPGPQLLSVERLDQDLSGNRMRMQTESTLSPLVAATGADAIRTPTLVG